MGISFLPVQKTVNVKGRVVSIVAQTRSSPLLRVHFWGRDSSGEIVVLEESRREWIDVTSAEKHQVHYIRIESMIKTMRLSPAGR